MRFHVQKFGTASALIVLLSASVQLAVAQTGRTKTQPGADKVSTDEAARLKQYLDKNGGYRDNVGGYYNPKAGIYTDAQGGIVDEWSGYTYRDGSYKSKVGDYWDEPKKTFMLASGENLKSKDTTSAEAIRVLRENVAERGGYEKGMIQGTMMARIKMEHPLTPAKSQKRP